MNPITKWLWYRKELGIAAKGIMGMTSACLHEADAPSWVSLSLQGDARMRNIASLLMLRRKCQTWNEGEHLRYRVLVISITRIFKILLKFVH